MTATTNTTISIPDNEQHTSVSTRYGMRFPDGTINWEHGYQTTSGRRVYWGVIATNGHRQEMEDWGSHLKSTAKNAHVDPEEFAAQHQPVKRTIVVAVTEAEDV